MIKLIFLIHCLFLTTRAGVPASDEACPLLSHLRSNPASVVSQRKVSLKKQFLGQVSDELIVDFNFLGWGYSGLVYKVRSGDETYVLKAYKEKADLDYDHYLLKILKEIQQGEDFYFVPQSRVGPANTLVMEYVEGETLYHTLVALDQDDKKRIRLIDRFYAMEKSITNALRMHPLIRSVHVDKKFGPLDFKNFHPSSTRKSGRVVPDGTYIALITFRFEGDPFDHILILKSDNIIVAADETLSLIDPR